MSRFRRQRRDVPGLNLAAMPDLIFTVLFFFMIVTHMRDVTPRVRYEVPQVTELEKAGRKAGMVYLFIGKPTDSQGRVLSDVSRIQLNNRYVAVGEIAAALAVEREKLPQHPCRPRHRHGHHQRREARAAQGRRAAHQLFGHQ